MVHSFRVRGILVATGPTLTIFGSHARCNTVRAGDNHRSPNQYIKRINLELGQACFRGFGHRIVRENLSHNSRLICILYMPATSEIDTHRRDFDEMPQ